VSRADWRWMLENCCCCSIQILAVTRGQMARGHCQDPVECEVSWQHLATVLVEETEVGGKGGFLEPKLVFIDVGDAQTLGHCGGIQLAGGRH
jgi:hypothetical protein